MVFANTAMASRANLEREMMSWMETEGVIPPGNGPEQELWEVQTVTCMFVHDYTCRACRICFVSAMKAAGVHIPVCAC